VLAENVEIAGTPFKRLRGLLGRSSFPSGEGLLIVPCRAVHTWFMRFPIDAVFLDEDFAVAGVVENMPPFRFSPYVRRARAALELPAGTVRETGTRTEDKIKLERSWCSINQAAKNPGLAAILSFFIVGLGQIYNGQIGKGIALMVAAVISGLLCAILVGFILFPVVWIYGIWDAYKTAEKFNRGGGAAA
jgi:hypothetical protein